MGKVSRDLPLAQQPVVHPKDTDIPLKPPSDLLMDTADENFHRVPRTELHDAVEGEFRTRPAVHPQFEVSGVIVVEGEDILVEIAEDRFLLHDMAGASIVARPELVDEIEPERIELGHCGIRRQGDRKDLLRTEIPKLKQMVFGVGIRRLVAQAAGPQFHRKVLYIHRLGIGVSPLSEGRLTNTADGPVKTIPGDQVLVGSKERTGRPALRNKPAQRAEVLPLLRLGSRQ